MRGADSGPRWQLTSLPYLLQHGQLAERIPCLHPVVKPALQVPTRITLSVQQDQKQNAPYCNCGLNVPCSRQEQHAALQLQRQLLAEGCRLTTPFAC